MPAYCHSPFASRPRLSAAARPTVRCALGQWPPPEFTLSARLDEAPVVLAFFPAAFSGTCRTEVDTLEERPNRLAAGATVYGVSTDRPFALAAFRESRGLSIGLLSDHGCHVVETYDAVTDFEDTGVDGLARRAVVVVDSEGAPPRAVGRRPATPAVGSPTDDATTAPDYGALLDAVAEAGRSFLRALFPARSVSDSSPGDQRTADGHGGQPYDPDANHHFPDGRLNDVLARLRSDPEVRAALEAQNVNAVVRKGYNDHGPTHIAIVRDRALRLYDLLKAGGVEFDGAREQGLDEADEPVVVALAATLHDVGHVVHRDRHSYYSIPLAANLLDRLLDESDHYGVAEAVRIKAETLHAILCHHTEEDPLTLEAGIVRVADGLDMERGRSRIPYEKGGRGINTLSSQAIRDVTLASGDDVPVVVEIEMVNAAGVYQVDGLLKEKLRDSGLTAHVRIVAVNTKTDDPLVERIEL